MRHLEEYAATLARNMELTYLNPVGLVTPNISMWRVELGAVEGQGPGGLRGWKLGCHSPRFAGIRSVLVARRLWVIGEEGVGLSARGEDP